MQETDLFQFVKDDELTLKDPFEILGVSAAVIRNSTPKDLADRVGQLAALYHPDRFPCDKPKQNNAGMVMKAINAAKDLLLNPESRDLCLRERDAFERRKGAEGRQEAERRPETERRTEPERRAKAESLSPLCERLEAVFNTVIKKFDMFPDVICQISQGDSCSFAVHPKFGSIVLMLRNHQYIEPTYREIPPETLKLAIAVMNVYETGLVHPKIVSAEIAQALAKETIVVIRESRSPSGKIIVTFPADRSVLLDSIIQEYPEGFSTPEKSVESILAFSKIENAQIQNPSSKESMVIIENAQKARAAVLQHLAEQARLARSISR